MRPTRKSTRERVITVMVLVICFLVSKAAAQSDKYPTMAPIDQYLMERNAEILLARSAAPDSISSDAAILVLGRQGICLVERSWMLSLIHLSTGTRNYAKLPPPVMTRDDVVAMIGDWLAQRFR